MPSRLDVELFKLNESYKTEMLDEIELKVSSGEEFADKVIN